MDKILLKLKEGKLPKVSGKESVYTRHVGNFHFTTTDYKAQEFELADARVALGTGDFELADPANPPVIATFPDDYPNAEELKTAGLLSVADVERATDDDLLAIDGIGKASLKNIRKVTPYLDASAQIFDPSFPIETATDAD
jgi:hypothetical protein